MLVTTNAFERSRCRDSRRERSGSTPFGIYHVLVVLGACFSGCHSTGAEEPVAAPPPVVARVLAVAPEHASAKELVGLTEPLRRASISTKLTARVNAVNAVEGDRVAAGAPLVRVAIDDLTARRAQALATVASADALGASAALNLDRARQLEASGAVPKQTLDDSKERVARNLAALDGARASVREIDAMLGDANIRAPFAGRVVLKQTEVGNYTVPGQPLMTIEDDSKLRVVAAIGAHDAQFLKTGAEYPIALSTGDVVQGTLDAILPAGGINTIGLRAVFVLANPSFKYHVGVQATVRIAGTESDRAEMRVPESALVHRGSLVGAYVVTDDRAHLVFCGIDGTTPDGAVRVIDGLRVGDVVVADASNPALGDGRKLVVTK